METDLLNFFNATQIEPTQMFLLIFREEEAEMEEPFLEGKSKSKAPKMMPKMPKIDVSKVPMSMLGKLAITVTSSLAIGTVIGMIIAKFREPCPPQEPEVYRGVWKASRFGIKAPTGEQLELKIRQLVDEVEKDEPARLAEFGPMDEWLEKELSQPEIKPFLGMNVDDMVLGSTQGISRAGGEIIRFIKSDGSRAIRMFCEEYGSPLQESDFWLADDGVVLLALKMINAAYTVAMRTELKLDRRNYEMELDNFNRLLRVWRANSKLQNSRWTQLDFTAAIQSFPTSQSAEQKWAANYLLTHHLIEIKSPEDLPLEFPAMLKRYYETRKNMIDTQTKAGANFFAVQNTCELPGLLAFWDVCRESISSYNVVEKEIYDLKENSNFVTKMKDGCLTFPLGNGLQPDKLSTLSGSLPGSLADRLKRLNAFWEGGADPELDRMKAWLVYRKTDENMRARMTAGEDAIRFIQHFLAGEVVDDIRFRTAFRIMYAPPKEA